MKTDLKLPEGSSPYDFMKSLWTENGLLTIQYCNDCTAKFYYPRSKCPQCWSDDITFEKATGHGTVLTHTTVYKGLGPELSSQSPISVAEISLDEGVSVIARIVSSKAVSTGSRVQLISARERRQYPLPTFQCLGDETDD